MAQHIPLEKIPLKRCQDKVKRWKGTKLNPTSMFWQEIEKNRFDYIRGLTVPESFVCGGKASLEAITDNNLIVRELYLVA